MPERPFVLLIHTQTPAPESLLAQLEQAGAEVISWPRAQATEPPPGGPWAMVLIAGGPDVDWELDQLRRLERLHWKAPVGILSQQLWSGDQWRQARQLGASELMEPPEQSALTRAKLQAALTGTGGEANCRSALERSRRNLDTLLDGVMDALLVVSRSGKILKANSAALDLFAKNSADLLGQEASELFWGADCPASEFKARLESAAVVAPFEWLAQGPEGEVEVQVGLASVVWEDHEARLISVRDISEHLSSQERLRKLSLAVEQSPASILITDALGRIEYVNPRFTELTGYSPEDVMGENPGLLGSGQTASEVYQELWRHLHAGQPWSGELINRRKSGELYFELTHISPIFNDQGKVTHYLGIKEDITERKQNEQALIEATEQAQQANKAKSEFLANMSHEIRTPMNAILGFAEILREQLEDAQQKEFLENIHGAGQALLTLINDILDLSKVEAGKLQLEYSPTDLRFLLEETGKIFEQKLAQKELLFTLDIDPELPPGLRLDAARLRQILLNLMGNAVKFTEQGSVQVSAWCEGEDPDQVDLFLAVEDTGIGIAQAAQETIFGAFEQVPGQGTQMGGTGLGLAITKRLVEMMGGQISLTSELGQGSRFLVNLPGLATSDLPQATEEEAMPEELDAESFAPAKLLIVDDIEMNRRLLVNFLAKAPFEIFEAQNGQEALELTRRFEPDLILMDLKMPVMDGFEASQRLKQDPQTAHIPILAVTAAVMKTEIDRIDPLCDGILAKPLTKAALIGKLRLYLSSSMPKNDRQDARPQAPTLAQPSAASLERLAKQLEGPLGQKGFEVAESLTLNDVEAWAQELSQAAAQAGHEPLYLWAQELYALARAFEADRLAEELSQLGEKIDQLKSGAANLR